MAIRAQEPEVFGPVVEVKSILVIDLQDEPTAAPFGLKAAHLTDVLAADLQQSLIGLTPNCRRLLGHVRPNQSSVDVTPFPSRVAE